MGAVTINDSKKQRVRAITKGSQMYKPLEGADSYTESFSTRISLAYYTRNYASAIRIENNRVRNGIYIDTAENVPVSYDRRLKTIK